jgi:adenylate cyclase
MTATLREQKRTMSGYLTRPIMTSAEHRARLRRTIPFGVIWFISAVLYTVVEKGVRIDSGATTGENGIITSLLINGLALLVMGLLMGAMEMYVLNRAFRSRPFVVYMVMKTGIYTAFIILSLLLVTTIHTSLYLGLSAFRSDLLMGQLIAATTVPFWCVILYLASVAAISLLLAEMSRHIGSSVLWNFFTGKYHVPKEEERIFMFLDMKSSTTIAEQMGHVRYFGLLNRYYADMTDAIIASSGVIHQYVGDEVVITWTLNEGLHQNNCLECFFRIKERLQAESANYVRQFGRAPGFKAGLHCGGVTTGEIGTLRKDLIFTGDVMNTTARIQSLCNESGVDLLVSEVLLSRLHLNAVYSSREIGVRELRGKEERVRLFTVTRSAG